MDNRAVDDFSSGFVVDAVGQGIANVIREAMRPLISALLMAAKFLA